VLSVRFCPICGGMPCSEARLRLSVGEAADTVTEAKRLYETEKSNTASSDDTWDNHTSSSSRATTALNAQSALSTPSAGSAPSAGRMARDDSSFDVLFSALIGLGCLMLLFGDRWLLG